MDACEEISAPDGPQHVKEQAVAALLVRCQKELANLTAKVSQLESRLEKQDDKQDRSGSDALHKDAYSAELTAAGIICSESTRHDQACAGCLSCAKYRKLIQNVSPASVQRPVCDDLATKQQCCPCLAALCKFALGPAIKISVNGILLSPKGLVSRKLFPVKWVSPRSVRSSGPATCVTAAIAAPAGPPPSIAMSASRVVMHEIVLPHMGDFMQICFGGQVLGWIDICAGLAAKAVSAM